MPLITRYLTGGATNTDPNLSLGGIASSTKIINQTANAPVNITGATIDDTIDNAFGDGTLTLLPPSDGRQVMRLYLTRPSPPGSIVHKFKLNDGYEITYISYQADAEDSLNNILYYINKTDSGSIDYHTYLHAENPVITSTNTFSYHGYIDIVALQENVPFTFTLISAPDPVYYGELISEITVPASEAQPNKSLTWAANGDTVGNAIALPSNGQYDIHSATVGTLSVTVDTGALPADSQTDAITISGVTNNLCDDFSGVETFDGHTDYRCYFIQNTAGYDIGLLKIQISDPDPDGELVMRVGVDPMGIVDGVTTYAQTITDENTTPTGVNFIKPLIGGGINEFNQALPNGMGFNLWVKRSISGSLKIGDLQQSFDIQYEIL